jgi:hypothetical protein
MYNSFNIKQGEMIMPKETIKEILIRRDSMTIKDADDLIKEAKDAFHEMLLHGETEEAYDICQDYFGLEPDYIWELM